MICEELKSRKNFVEEDFIELRDSVEELISVIEKYKDMIFYTNKKLSYSLFYDGNNIYMIKKEKK